jgi:hypothetical protein
MSSTKISPPGILLAFATVLGGGCSTAGHNAESAQSNAIAGRIEGVRATEDRMVADAKAASAGREEIYRRDANYFKDTEDRVCKVAARSGSAQANPSRIAGTAKSIKNDNEGLRTVTTDAASRVLRRSEVNDPLIASECRNAEVGSDVYFQCSAMEHARSWHRVIALELSELNTINDSASGWAVGSLECLEAALTKRLEKDDIELSQSIYQAWSGYKSRRISSAQSLDEASAQFAQSKK